MSKRVFPVTVLLVLLAGCWFERAERSTPAPEEYLTALEAYEQIRPAMLAWHEDAVVISVSSVHSERAEWRVRADGRAVWWSFMVYSPSASRETDISFREGKIRVGIPAIAGGEVPVYGAKEGLPLDSMIDSDEAMKIALQNGARGVLYSIGIDRYDSKTGRYIPPSWGLTYGHPHDWSQQQRVIIDAVTGEVLRNDFAGP
jgi:hypothetical protein